VNCGPWLYLRNQINPLLSGLFSEITLLKPADTVANANAAAMVEAITPLPLASTGWITGSVTAASRCCLRFCLYRRYPSAFVRSGFAGGRRAVTLVSAIALILDRDAHVGQQLRGLASLGGCRVDLRDHRSEDA
jgi:hypothetical protein